MKNSLKPIRILAIETSCDETAAAVIGCANKTEEPKNKETKEQNRPVILSNIVSSQVDLHAKTGGVVPEVASRAHIEAIIPVIEEALFLANSKIQETNPKQIPNLISQSDIIAREKIPHNFGTGSAIFNNKEIATPSHNGEWLAMTDNNSTIQQFNNILLSEITHIAVTVGPGLIGSLLVGFNTAKALAYALDIPIIPVNHIEGHIYSALVQDRITNNQETNSKQYQNSKSQAINNNETIEQLNNELEFPILALTVSGGHTSLTLIHDHGKYENIGSTLDDAAGEAFDKVAKLLGLGYPGGSAVSRVAEKFRNSSPRYKIQDIPQGATPRANKSQALNSNIQKDCHSGLDPESIEMDSCLRRNDKNEADAHKLKAENSISLPLPLWQDSSYNFSYSGLKTAVLMLLRKAEKEYQNSPEKLEEFKQELACVFEETAVAHLIDKTIKAAKKYQVKTVLLAGGVSANKWLRQQLSAAINNLAVQQTHVIARNEAISNNSTIQQSNNIRLLLPPMEMTGDNAAMIGLATYYHVLRGEAKKWNEIKVDSNLKL